MTELQADLLIARTEMVIIVLETIGFMVMFHIVWGMFKKGGK